MIQLLRLLTCLASLLPTVARAATLYEQKKPAVLKIEVLEQGIPISFGAGFFVAADGTFVTNRHVIEALAGPGFSLRVTDSDGKEVPGLEVSWCGVETIDVCFFRGQVKPKAWFDLRAPGSNAIGSEVFAIGHPRGYAYSFTNGIWSGSRTFDGVDEIQFTTPISPGNSGGPLFGKDGALVGMATWIRVDPGSQNLNFGISRAELLKRLTRISDPVPLTKWHAQINQFYRTLSDELTKKYHAPFRRAIEDFEHAAPGKQMSAYLGKVAQPYEVSRGTHRYRFYLPRPFVNCRRGANAGELTCPVDIGKVDIAVDPKPAGQPGLASFNGKVVIPARPLQIVTAMQKDGSWEGYEKTLTPQQRKYFYSFQDVPAKCQTSPNPDRGLPAYSGLQECSFVIYNDATPNGVTEMIVLQPLGSDDWITIVGHAAHPMGSGFYYQMASFVALTIERVSP